MISHSASFSYAATGQTHTDYFLKQVDKRETHPVSVCVRLWLIFYDFFSMSRFDVDMTIHRWNYLRAILPAV